MNLEEIVAKKGLLLTPSLEAVIAADIENRVAKLYADLTCPKKARGRKKGKGNDSNKES